MTRLPQVARSSNELESVPPSLPPASTSRSAKTKRMISSPMAMRPQAAQVPFRPCPIPSSNLDFLHPSGDLGAREMMRSSSWESSRSDRGGTEAAQESVVSVVISEADDTNEDGAAQNDLTRSRADQNRISVYTEDCVNELERQEDGALRLWMTRYDGISRNASQESTHYETTTPELPELSLSPSMSRSPASQGPLTPPSHFRDGAFESLSPPSSQSRSRSSSASTFPLRQVDQTDGYVSAFCGGLNIFFPHRNSLSHRSSTPNLRSPSNLTSNFDDSDEDWEHFPIANRIPANKAAQKYAFPIEEQSFLKKVVRRKPEVRARPRYKALRDVPPVPKSRTGEGDGQER